MTFEELKTSSAAMKKDYLLVSAVDMSLILSTASVLTYVLRSHIFRAHFQVNWVPSSEIF